MEQYLLALVSILVAVIGYFLVNLHNRLEEHLRASAVADVEFGKLQVKQEELFERVEKLETKVDTVSDKIDLLPYKIVAELLKSK